MRFHPVTRGLLSLVLAAGIGGCGGGSNEVALQPFPEATRAQLDAALNKTRTALNIPGVIVSLYIPGEGFWETSVGVEDKQTQKAMLAGMHTRIGSITKTFTVTAILLLADDKRLQLDDKISKYLDFVPNGDNITLRQMANMTSGLYSYTKDDDWVRNMYLNPHRTYTARELVDAGFNHQPHYYSFTPPGSSIDYSNTNTVLLGMVVEKVSGMKVEDFFAQRIYRPLGLNNTSWPTNADMPTPFSHGYTKQTPTGSEADATFFNPSWGHAAGQMISHLEDLKIWAKALGEGTLLSAEMQRERLTWAPFGPPTFRYGLGIGYYNGWIGHTGSLPGYNTGVYYLPAKKAVLVIQTNTDTPRIITPGNPPVQEEPVNGVFREIAKIVTPNNVPDGNDFTDDELPD
jgi:D-alanyl-D-alanine carboxypeptidase